MKPFIRKKLPFLLIALQAVLILGMLLYIVPGRYRLYDIVLYDASENVPANPLTGYAPDALREEDCAGTNLVFLTLPFSEWEPEKGVFDAESVSEKYHLEEYRRAGKHAVLRFVCDIPGESAHADIPQWLLEETGDGVAYEDAAGKGYAPDYSNAVFQEAHREALKELAAWCRRDSFVAYVEAGSVGRNGVWDESAESAPEISGAVRSEYLRQYEEAFPPESGIRLLCCAKTGADMAAGSWKDALGDAAASGNWKKEILDREEAGEDDAETSAGLYADFPVAGGMTDTAPMEDLLMDRLSDTLEQIRDCHISFIGPVCPDAVQQESNGSEMILRNVGYCIYLSRLQTTVDFLDDDLLLHFTFSNIGQAPLYWDWPVRMYIYDHDGICIREQTLDLKLSELLPDRELTVTGTVPYSKELLEGYSVGLSIVSPGGDIVTFAQKGVLPDAQGVHTIYRAKRKAKGTAAAAAGTKNLVLFRPR